VQDEADQEQVMRFVESLSQLRPSRALIETTGQPADYDLDPPDIQVDVTMQDGAVHTLRLGAMNPSQSGYYGQVASDATIYLMPFSVGADAERMLNTPPIKPTPTPEAQATQPPLIPPRRPQRNHRIGSAAFQAAYASRMLALTAKGEETWLGTRSPSRRSARIPLRRLAQSWIGRAI
jgi:hypothetical protein